METYLYFVYIAYTSVVMAFHGVTEYGTLSYKKLVLHIDVSHADCEGQTDRQTERQRERQNICFLCKRQHFLVAVSI